MRPDDFAFAKDNAPLVTAPHGTAERPGLNPGPGGAWPAIAGGQDDRPAVAGPASTAGRDSDPLASLPIRSAERRRWAADLTGPDLAGLVLHGAGGIGKSALLRELVLGQVPVLLVLDDFDDNVSPDSGGWTVRDPALAELIASWGSKSHRARLLITCRDPFRPPRTSGPPLTFHHVGPLSRSGAFELAKSLPAIGSLGEQELDRAWRLLGGHPQAMEYLDSLLATGHVRFPEVARRLAVAVEGKSGSPTRPAGPAAPTELAPATAESVALAARDLLLCELGGPSPVTLPWWAAGPLRRRAAQHRPARPGRPRRATATSLAGLVLAGLVLAGLVLAAAAGAFALGRSGSSAAHADPAQAHPHRNRRCCNRRRPSAPGRPRGWPGRSAGTRSWPVTRTCAPRCWPGGSRPGTCWKCAARHPIRSAPTSSSRPPRCAASSARGWPASTRRPSWPVSVPGASGSTCAPSRRTARPPTGPGSPRT
jgi:hypothetical protein